MTIQSIAEKITSKFIMFLVGLALTTSTGFLTKVFNEQSESNQKVLIALDGVNAVIKSIQKSNFDNNVARLKNQSYKIEFDKEDIKPAWITSSANFCVSPLYKQFITEVTGSELIGINKSCNDVNQYVKSHQS